MTLLSEMIVEKQPLLMHYHWQMFIEKKSLWIPKFDWLNRENAYTYINIKIIYADAQSFPDVNWNEEFINV